MLKLERKQIIMEHLEQQGFVKLEDLTERLESSESTIRRDLDELAAENKLKRIHGGAELQKHLQEELTNSQKSIKNVQEKTAIVLKARTLIEEQDVIFIDAGTTNALLIDMLPLKNITVVTNSIHHAARLVDKGLRTIIIGGFVKHSTDASIGQGALEQIKQLNFDKAFVGINGIDDDFLTTPDMDEAAVKRQIIANTKETYVLADSSKISQVSFVKVAPVESVVLLTNRSTDKMLDRLKKKIKVIEV